MIELATAAIALVVPYLAKVGEGTAKALGEKIVDKLENVYSTIRHKFDSDNDDYARQTFDRLQQKPEDQQRQSSAANVLAEKLASDKTFAETLQKLVEDSSGDPMVNQFITQVYGGSVGKILNIGRAGNVNA